MTAPEDVADGAVDDPFVTGSTPTDNPVLPRFTDTEDWVSRWLAPALAFKLTGDGRGLVFCERWWAHRPVAVRFNALWEAWEQARRAGTMSTWWISHADPTLRAVCDGETGPMRHCDNGHHHPTAIITVVRAPEGWADLDQDVLDAL